MKVVCSIMSVLTLSLGLLIAPAYAQSGVAMKAGGPHIREPQNAFDLGPPLTAEGPDSTGSIGRSYRRQIDQSAKEGNAEENDRAVPNFGETSGGPAE